MVGIVYEHRFLSFWNWIVDVFHVNSVKCEPEINSSRKLEDAYHLKGKGKM